MKQKGPNVHKKVQRIGQKTYVSRMISIEIESLEEPWHRAEIVIQNLDGSAFSYEGRIFLNNPRANHKTELSLKYGYVGSYHIFGYGGISLDDIYHDKSRFDYRPSQSPVVPYKRIIVTDALRVLGKNTTRFTITIVPILPDSADRTVAIRTDIIRFDKIGIIIR